MRDETLVMHAEINIGGCMIMVAEATEQYKVQTAAFFIYVDGCDKALQTAIENGASVVREPATQGYGRSAGVKDVFGNTWWLTS